MLSPGGRPCPQPKGKQGQRGSALGRRTQPLGRTAAGRRELTHVHGGHLPAVGRMGYQACGKPLVVEGKTGLRAWEQIGEQGLGSQGPGWRKDTQARGGRALAPEPSCLPGPAGQARPGPLRRARVSGHVDGALCEMLRAETRVLEVPGSGQHRATAWSAPGRWEERWRGRVSRPVTQHLRACWLWRPPARPTRSLWDGSRTEEAGQAACEPGRGCGSTCGGRLSGARLAGGQAGRASGPLSLGQRAQGETTGTPSSDGGLELSSFVDGELNVFVRSGRLSEPALGQLRQRVSPGLRSGGRASGGQDFLRRPLLGLGRPPWPCPHAAGCGVVFLAVSFSV